MSAHQSTRYPPPAASFGGSLATSLLHGGVLDSTLELWLLFFFGFGKATTRYDFFLLACSNERIKGAGMGQDTRDTRRLCPLLTREHGHDDDVSGHGY